VCVHRGRYRSPWRLRASLGQAAGSPRVWGTSKSPLPAKRFGFLPSVTPRPRRQGHPGGGPALGVGWRLRGGDESNGSRALAVVFWGHTALTPRILARSKVVDFRGVVVVVGVGSQGVGSLLLDDGRVFRAQAPAATYPESMASTVSFWAGSVRVKKRALRGRAGSLRGCWVVGVGSRGVGSRFLGDGEANRAETFRLACWHPKRRRLSFWAGSEVVDFGRWVGVGS